MRALQTEKTLVSYNPNIMKLGGIDEEFVIDLLHFCEFKGWSHLKIIEASKQIREGNVSLKDRQKILCSVREKS